MRQSPEYNVVSVRPRHPKSIPLPRPQFANLLVDFLHDARAYDYKDQGYVIFPLSYLLVILVS